jgi:hypothetical protein
VNAFLAGSVPIYLGSPDVAAHFDSRSFINCHGMELSACAAEVERVDKNQTLYDEMRTHAVLHNNVLGQAFSWHSKVLSDSRQNSPIQKLFEEYLLEREDGYPTSPKNLISPFCEFPSPPPDITLLWYPRTVDIYSPLSRALTACPSSSSMSASSHELSVTCQLTSPRRLQGYISCELYGDFKNLAFKPSYGRASGRLELFSKSRASPEDPQQPVILLMETNEAEEDSCVNMTAMRQNIQGVIVPSKNTPVGLSSGENLLSLPVLSISAVDYAWISHEVESGVAVETPILAQKGEYVNTHQHADGVNFEVVFKAQWGELIGALLDASKLEPSSSSDCIAHALFLSPLTSQVNLAAARACASLGMSEYSELYLKRAEQLVL